MLVVCFSELLWGVCIYNKGVVVVVVIVGQLPADDRSGGKKAVPIAETTDVQGGNRKKLKER